MRQYMYILWEEVVLYLFALQCSQDQLQQWKLEEGCPRGFLERPEWASCVLLCTNSPDQTSTRG